ncbi:MAG: 16S rRNA (guanine(527)-N(7))-methyltransferase RsmG [Acidobacteriota bacterium]|nr:16S rRNA (guanine(527)-N(7))-methyltransferase RsmG [Acidobacteriota bacterium]
MERDWPHIYAQLASYLELIIKWNARTNLTAIREPEQIVRRHFGESLFAGIHLGRCSTLLDFGSGAGFPGIPIQILSPEIAVTLAESQGKKAAFLREALRTLGLTSEVWISRVESMPADRQFDTVTLRAVDDMDAAVAEASRRARRQLLILTTSGRSYPFLAKHFLSAPEIPLPESQNGVLLIASRP